MDTLILFFEVIGTISFAVSGAFTAIKKNMDIFGVVILGLTTAVGGGIIRDLILGITPPKTFQDPLYAVIAIVSSIVVFVLVYMKKLEYENHVYELIMLVMDTIGLAAFTVVGMGVAYGQQTEYSSFLLIFVGVITGVGGGVMRDLFAGDRPYIFVKHVYACASIVGAVVCEIMSVAFSYTAGMVSGIIVIVTLRFLSAYFRWNLPKIKYTAGKV